MCSSCRASAFLLAGLLVASTGVADEMVTLECPRASKIHFEDCSVLQGQEGTREHAVLLHYKDGCLFGSAGDPPRPCREAALLAIDTMARVDTGRMETELVTDGERLMLDLPFRETLKLPTAACKVVTHVRGYEDLELDPLAVSELRIRPGQRLIVEASDKAPRDLTVNLKGPRDISRRFRSNAPVELGSLPLGSYQVEIRGAGVATVRAVVELTDRYTARSLHFAIEPAGQVDLQVDASRFQRPPVVEAKLELLPENGPGVSVFSGKLGLHASPERRGLLAGRLADLHFGTYRLRLRGPGVEVFEQVFSVKPGQVVPISVDLRPALTGRVRLVDEAGAPVSDASVGLAWRDEAGAPHAIDLEVDGDGYLWLPGLSVPVRGILNVWALGFAAAKREISSDEDTIMTLRRAGSVRGRLAPETCSQGPVRFELLVPQSTETWRSVESAFLDGCEFEREVKRAGRYRVRLSAADLRPFSAEFELDGATTHDLGEIRMESGERAAVFVKSGSLPVAGASVWLEETGFVGVTDSDGRVDFESLDPQQSSVTVRVEHPDYATVRREMHIPWNRTLAIALSSGGSIRGRVLRQDGTPAEGDAIVAFGPDRTSCTAVVDVHGLYRIERLHPGGWQVCLEVQADHGGLFTQRSGNTMRVEVAEGDETVADFVPRVPVELRIQRRVGCTQELLSAQHPRAGLNILLPASPSPIKAVLPASGIWVFFDCGVGAVREISDGCPCLIDLDFTQKARE